ncbi:MAG: hypothetical protein ACO3C1_12170 [Ilumatobacteraceae bacterium]
MTSTSDHFFDRRNFLVLAGGATVLAACGGADSSATTGTSGTIDTGSAATTVTDSSTSVGGSSPAACLTPPSETSGPFPSDGSNSNGAGGTADALHDPRCVRRDIRSNFDGSDTQEGTPMTLTVYVNDSSCNPLVGAAVYLWHCSKEGAYSGYSSRMLGGNFADATWLRGVQVVDADGTVTFDTILPGRYSGRAAHIHFEVFADDTLEQSLLVSQMAFDDEGIDSLYEAAGYATSLQHDTDNADDHIFSDGVDQQLLTISGDGATAVTAAIRVAL